MSVIVKNMEMPQKCGQCKLFHAEHPMHCQAVKAHKDKRIIAPYGAPIPDWCPLVEIPTPHGRLIDADALKNDMRDWNPSIIAVVDAMSTVIESEGSEK